MGKSNCWNGVRVALLICATAFGLSAQGFTTLASFNGPDGAQPSSLVQGADGNFYGITMLGGPNDWGTVFKITSSGMLTTLYRFCSQTACADGASPGELIQGTDGNFYGITTAGGDAPAPNGNGTVFKITPAGTLTMLYTFSPGTNGNSPAALIQATDGNLYGTTTQGGTGGQGTVFKLTPGGALTALYNFCSQGLPCTDGTGATGLIQAADGNFYGTTVGGGEPLFDSGTIFRLTPSGTFTTLYNFCSQPACADGANPAGLVQATDGNFYGTTIGGGVNNEVNGGTVFKVTPGGSLTTMYSFCFLAGCADGAQPRGGLTQASDGNFYGTTSGGGINGGTVFKITPGGTLTTLYSFCPQAVCADGSDPTAGVIHGSGNLYGTTVAGGASGDGTVFKLALASSTTPPGVNQSGGVLNGASFQTGIVAGSWITIYGTNFSSTTDTWTSAIVNGKLPPSLNGVKVSVGGEPAYISYISPAQINAVAPNVGTGPVSVTVTNSRGRSSAITTTAQAVQPAFFLWGNYAVATTLDYTLAVKNGTFYGVTTAPAKPGEVIVLWGTGFGPTSPSAPVGIEAPSSPTYYTANTVSATVGGKTATVYSAVLAPGFAGLYQVAIQIPASLTNGDYPVVAKISGVQSSATTLISVQE
jgi:uncharacterized protein (TIGR03437 family)